MLRSFKSFFTRDFTQDTPVAGAGTAEPKIPTSAASSSKLFSPVTQQNANQEALTSNLNISPIIPTICSVKEIPSKQLSTLNYWQLEAILNSLLRIQSHSSIKNEADEQAFNKLVEHVQNCRDEYKLYKDLQETQSVPSHIVNELCGNLLLLAMWVHHNYIIKELRSTLLSLDAKNKLEQEIDNYITLLINALPQEERKAYLTGSMPQYAKILNYKDPLESEQGTLPSSRP